MSITNPLPGYDAWKLDTPPEYDVEPEDDSPACKCQLEPTEDEDAENQCACCGLPLRW